MLVAVRCCVFLCSMAAPSAGAEAASCCQPGHACITALVGLAAAQER